MTLAKRVADFLRDGTKQTHYSVARLKDGTICQPNHPDAVSWCAIGAAEKLGGHDEAWALRRAFQDRYNETLDKVNDQCSNARLIQMLEAL